MKFKHLITEKDNDTLCPLRTFFFLYAGFYLAASCAFLHDFLSHAQQWAEGASALILQGATIIAKAKWTEKDDV